ncbi:MAG: site-specific DNA-methyltransferase [Ectothiorhodospiraceae bacterium AqS1]|nr:site-specific DNA-methyltransferase [Ectothiorhodospiraceae bacterium AqS1]
MIFGKSDQEILFRIRDCFPDAITETERKGEDGKPYIVYALKAEFLDEIKGLVDISDDKDRYELRFPGKRQARLQAQIPSDKTLIMERGIDSDFNETGNLFIEGDNLDVLRMLQKSYRERIKMIYIDPPYNTGNDDFIYQDDFSQSQQEYLKDIGVLDEDGVRQISEMKDKLRGRFHAGWLAMIYPRLKLARELLTDDGVIFISIDDNEQANLKLICDEIFGENNFVSNIIWQRASGGGNASDVVTGHDFILLYKKNKDLKFYGDESSRGKVMQIDEKQLRVDDDVVRKHFGRYKKGIERRCYYEELSEYKNKNQIDDIEAKINKGEYILIKQPNNKHFIGQIIEPGQRKILYSIVQNILNSQGTDELNNLGIAFSNPKPVDLIRYLINSNLPKDSLVLDFFAGSATTAHAVMQLNAEDGGNRRFIMVQLPEEIDPKKSKEAYDFCIDNLPPPPKKMGRRSGGLLFRPLPISPASVFGAPEKKSSRSIRKRVSISAFDPFAWWIRYFLETPKRLWPIPAKPIFMPIVRI